MKSLLIIGLMVAASQAHAETYILTLTNGGVQPVSPPVVYAIEGQAEASPVGSESTPGFTAICERGDANARAMELQMNSQVKNTQVSAGPIMPGESRVVEVEVMSPNTQSIHFESMYGKTKDACAVGSVNAHSLIALRQHVTSAVRGQDQVVQSGAFMDPVIPMGMSYLDDTVCSMQNTAVGCLRSLALPTMRTKKVRYFNAYLSSVNMLLERKYGATETASLSIPGAGGVRFEVRLKH